MGLATIRLHLTAAVVVVVVVAEVAVVEVVPVAADVEVVEAAVDRKRIDQDQIFAIIINSRGSKFE